MTTVLDGARKGSAKASWVLMRRSKKRTRLGPQVHGENLRRFRQLRLEIEKPDRYWSAPARPSAAIAPGDRAFGSAKSRAPTRRTPAPRPIARRSPTPPKKRSHRPRRPSPPGVGHDDHALIRFDPWAVGRIDDHGLGRRRRAQRQGLWTKNRTGIGPHPPARKAQCFQSRKLAMSGGLNLCRVAKALMNAEMIRSSPS